MKYVKPENQALAALELLRADFEKKATPRAPYKAMRCSLTVAINAVKKQIPQKVNKGCRCPVCNKLASLRYCSGCGQRLDWRDLL